MNATRNPPRLFCINELLCRRGVILVNSILLVGLPSIRGAEITQVYAFSNYFNPSTLYEGTNGNYFGTAGGASNSGIIFQVSTAGDFNGVAEFTPPVGLPFAGGPLVQDSNGSFYGTAPSAGGFGRYGTVYRVANGIVTNLVSFDGTNGARPAAGLIRSSDGNYYGTTQYGGASYRSLLGSPLTLPGTIFRISESGTLTNLLSFNRTNGASPAAPLLWGLDGFLYGTTVGGGASGSGTIFRVTTNGALSTLFTFDGTNGANPYGGLLQAADGKFYGTTAHGGVNDFGTVYQLTTNGIFTMLASFNGTNGAYPYAGLVRGYDGKLYGTTQSGGLGFDGSNNSGYGTVFGVTTNGLLTTLGELNGTNGAHPVTALVQGKDGILYGSASFGGSHDNGSIFRVAIPIEIQATPNAGSALSLTWNALSGRTYQVQYRIELGSTNWNDLGTTVTATNGTCSVVDAIEADARRFYRVSLLP